MRKSTLSAAVAASLALSFATLAAANGPDPNRFIVQIKPGSAAGVANALRAAGGQIHHQLDSVDAIAVTLPTQALDGISRNPNVVHIEQDAPRYLLGQTTPYGVPMVKAPDLVGTGANGTGIKVCIIDSGIKANHEDFAGIAMTGSASSGQTWSTDSCGHGTHVAGTIAAANNTVGVVGVSPGKVSLHIVKVFDGASCAWSYASTLVAAAQNCQSAGAKVINMSLGGSTASRTEETAFNNLNAAGILSIAAAGNDGNTRKSYPASYASVMSVAAIDSTKALATFSQRNDAVEIAAPGVAVLSTYPITSGSASVGSSSFIASALEGSPGTSASASWVNGGRCTTTGGGSYTGKIVLCERGDIAFADKVVNAQNGGGLGVIMYNNAPGGFSGTLNGIATTIPSVSISQEDGQAIIANGAGQLATVNAATQNDANGYAYLDGTSMATPHVAGVAAIVWSAKPTATNTQVRNALTSTAEDLGAVGRDTSFGFGLVDALDAANALLGGGGGGGTPAVPTSLTGSKSRKGSNYTYNLAWSGGAGTVDVYRNGTRVAAGIANSGSYRETNTLATATYQVCNAGTTGSTNCSNSLAL